MEYIIWFYQHVNAESRASVVGSAIGTVFYFYYEKKTKDRNAWIVIAMAIATILAGYYLAEAITLYLNTSKLRTVYSIALAALVNPVFQRPATTLQAIINFVIQILSIRLPNNSKDINNQNKPNDNES